MDAEMPNQPSAEAEPALSPSSTIVCLPDLEHRERLLAIFDVDGTLLVSKGREVVTSPQGLRAAIHPLVEPCGSALPSGCSSDFAFSGEEDLNGDAFALVANACIIEPVAERLRKLMSSEEAEVAILSARGHDPVWLAKALTEKLQLARPLDPKLVMTVYSAGFEADMPPAVAAGRTADRKAHALGLMISRVAPSKVEFYDDMPANLEKAASYMSKAHAGVTFRAMPVPAADSIAACSACNVDYRELIYFQCRDEAGAPNALVDAMMSTELAVQLSLIGYTRPPLEERDTALPP